MKAVFPYALLLAVLPVTVTAQYEGHSKNEIVVETTLESIQEQPDAFKGVEVQFDVQYCSMGKIANPFFTRFTPTSYANFYVWADAQPIWRRDSYEDIFGMMFLSKENESLFDLYNLRLYDRISVKGVVRNVFQGKPWIEVQSFSRKANKVSTATLSHLFRGETHMGKREWRRAIAELSLAPAADVPVSVSAAVHKNLGLCYLRLGESETAMTHLNRAATMVGGGDRETVLLLQTAQANPEEALDRAVDSTEILDSERPMWEAFEDFEPAVEDVRDAGAPVAVPMPGPSTPPPAK